MLTQRWVLGIYQCIFGDVTEEKFIFIFTWGFVELDDRILLQGHQFRKQRSTLPFPLDGSSEGRYME